MQATPIQAKVIPIVLEDKDVMGAAQTETGNTTVFRSGKGFSREVADDAHITLRGIFSTFLH